MIRTPLKLATAIAACMALAMPAGAEEKSGGIVSLGGSVTEIIYALGAADRLVARDTTSNYPEAAQELPDVGYVRALSPEGVLSVSPTMIIAEQGAGPLETITILQGADIPYIEVPEVYTAQGVIEKVKVVGNAIGEPEKAQKLADEIAVMFDAASEKSKQHAENPKRVMFILSTQGGRIMASGTGTAAASMIEMAGAQNAVSAFSGYKPMTDEAVIAAAPDVIVMMERGGEHDSVIDDLVKLPAVASTPAGANRSVIRMDGLYLLGFGPRTANAVSDLITALDAS